MNYKRARRNAALILAMAGAHKLEKMHDMRKASNCGTNTMCLYGRGWPFDFGAGMKEQAKMTDETEELWIELDDAEENGKFYFASPCKADLIVERTECKCTEFWDAKTIHTDVVIHELYEDSAPCVPPEGGCMEVIGHTIYHTFNVHVEFHQDPVDKKRFVHKFKLKDGEDNAVTFTYNLTFGDSRGLLKYFLLNMSDTPFFRPNKPPEAIAPISFVFECTD